jgi:hypothetical protein
MKHTGIEIMGNRFRRAFLCGMLLWPVSAMADEKSSERFEEIVQPMMRAVELFIPLIPWYNETSGEKDALGWGVTQRDWGGGTVLNHTGCNTMNFANVWIAPKKDFAILVCVNQGDNTAFKASDEAVATLIKLYNSKRETNHFLYDKGQTKGACHAIID